MDGDIEFFRRPYDDVMKDDDDNSFGHIFVNLSISTTTPSLFSIAERLSRDLLSLFFQIHEHELVASLLLDPGERAVRDSVHEHHRVTRGAVLPVSDPVEKQ